jgi:hypothetical protein
MQAKDIVTLKRLQEKVLKEAFRNKTENYWCFFVKMQWNEDLNIELMDKTS